MVAVADAWSMKGDTDRALALLNELHGYTQANATQWARDSTMAIIAASLALAGDLGAALKLARSIESPGAHVIALTKIALHV